MPPTSNENLSFFSSCSEWERPLHQRAFQQRPPERRKEAFFFFFCTQKESAFPKICNVETCFLYQRLNFRGCPPNAPPHFTSAPFCQKKKKRRPKQHATTHPAECIQICLPKEGKKRKTEKIIIMTITLLDRCGFNPHRKTFVVSTCCGIRFLSCSLFLFSLLHSGLSGEEKARSQPCVPRSEAALTSGPLWAQDRSRPGKSLREKIVASWAPARVREPGARAAEGRPRSAARSLGLSGLSHHGLCVLLCRGFHTRICCPIFQSAAIQQKIFLYQDSCNTSQGKPDVK